MLFSLTILRVKVITCYFLNKIHFEKVYSIALLSLLKSLPLLQTHCTFRYWCSHSEMFLFRSLVSILVPFIFLIESANSTVDLFSKPGKVAPTYLEGKSWKIDDKEVKEPGISSAAPAHRQQDKGEQQNVRLDLLLPWIPVMLEIGTKIW